MKVYVIIFSVLTLVFLLAPAAAVKRGESPAPPSSTALNETQEASSEPTDSDTIKVLRSVDNSVLTLTTEEYLTGAVAAEMSATCHEEALKAQAVACCTYALYNKLLQQSAPTLSLSGAYLTDSPLKHQGYLSPEQRKEKWGDNYQEYEKKIKKAVTAVSGKALTYDGEYIIAAFHSICPGMTEDAKTVWGEDIAYLKSVVSDGDRLSPDYSDTLVLTPEQLRDLFSDIDGIDFDSEPSQWIGEAQCSKSGTVMSMSVGGVSLTGQEIRTVLGLRSSAFTIELSDGCFTIKTVGYGHFVGMSQYGADYMARQGAGYEEILTHYYTGVTISDV